MTAISMASSSPQRRRQRRNYRSSSSSPLFFLFLVFAFAAFPPPPFLAVVVVVDAVEIATTPVFVYFDAAKRVQFDVSFDLDAVRRRDVAAAAKNEAAVAVFQTDFTLLLLDGGGAADGSGVVRGVTETRQFRGKWGRKGNAAVEGTLIQNYDVDLARVQDLKHKWEIVDERLNPAITWNFTSHPLLQQHVVSSEWFTTSFSLPRSTGDLLRLCTSRDLPIASTCCICHSGSTPLTCKDDGTLDAEAALTSDATTGSGACLGSSGGGGGAEKATKTTSPCPFVCECQRKCQAPRMDTFITWTLLCCFIAFLILYYVINACAVAFSARSAATGCASTPGCVVPARPPSTETATP